MIRNQTGAGNWEKRMTRTARISSREFSCTPVCRHYFFLFKYFSSRVLNCNGTFFPQLISNVSCLSFHSSCPSSLSCDFTLLDKLKQIAPRTYSRAAKPSRFDFFFFYFSPRLKHASWLQVLLGWACSQFSGSSEPDLLKNTSIIPGDTIRGPVFLCHLKYHKYFICIFFSSPSSYISELWDLL